MKTAAWIIGVVWIFAHSAVAQAPTSVLDKIYSDESHCLIGPEIRQDSDGPISCYCRDALVDARYVYHTYLIAGKDVNLNGTYLALEAHTQQMCGKDYAVFNLVRATNWRWEGPEVRREYLPDEEIKKIAPDKDGWRTAPYKVHLTFRDSNQNVIKTEGFVASERLPPDFKFDHSH
jgi:hypothetical protein